MGAAAPPWQGGHTPSVIELKQRAQLEPGQEGTVRAGCWGGRASRGVLLLVGAARSSP